MDFFSKLLLVILIIMLASIAYFLYDLKDSLESVADGVRDLSYSTLDVKLQEPIDTNVSFDRGEELGVSINNNVSIDNQSFDPLYVELKNGLNDFNVKLTNLY